MNTTDKQYDRREKRTERGHGMPGREIHPEGRRKDEGVYSEIEKIKAEISVSGE